MCFIVCFFQKKSMFFNFVFLHFSPFFFYLCATVLKHNKNKTDGRFKQPTRWKHKWRWHNRGCVLDKIASDWARVEEWTECSGRNDECEAVCRAHRPNIGESVTPNKERKEPRHLDPPDLSIDLRTEGPTLQLCGNNNVGRLRETDVQRSQSGRLPGQTRESDV